MVHFFMVINGRYGKITGLMVSYSFNNRRMGMTLVEILIVLAIIALIASMSIPSFYLVTRRTRRAICLNNLRVLRGAGETYCIDEKVSDETLISQDDLINTEYIREKTECPEGDIEYSPFKIKDGPVCPNIITYPDHKLED